MSEEIDSMPYKEAWQKSQEDYLVAIGSLYNYLLEEHGEEVLIDYLENVEVDRFDKYFEETVSLAEKAASKLAPEKAFEEKIKSIAYEFQFFLGVDNIEIEELGEGEAKIRLPECPYQKAIQNAPADLGLSRDLYCKYQCGHYIRGVCEEVLGWSIEFDPQEKGCIYRVSNK